MEFLEKIKAGYQVRNLFHLYLFLQKRINQNEIDLTQKRNTQRWIQDFNTEDFVGYSLYTGKL